MFKIFVDKVLREDLEKLQSERRSLLVALGAAEEKLENSERKLAAVLAEKQQIEFDLRCAKDRARLDTEKELNDLRKNMQEALIKSDLLRTEAVAKLAVYEKLDTKADANIIKDSVKSLIEGLSKKSEVSIVK